MVGITIQEFPKSQSNDTDINKTDLSETEFSKTEYSKTDLNDTESGVSVVHPNPIQSNLSISGTVPDVMDEMDAYRDIIREHISYECFQDHEHIEYILTCLGANTTKVGNIKAYLLTTLYNAPMTISNYYTAEVNHDLYGSG